MQVLVYQPSMKKMKKAAKFARDTSSFQITRQDPIAKESAMIAKAKHMLFVNHNTERAFEETIKEGHDFKHSRN